MKRRGNASPSLISRDCEDGYGAAGNPCLHLRMHDDRTSHSLSECRSVAAVIEKADLVVSRQLPRRDAGKHPLDGRRGADATPAMSARACGPLRAKKRRRP